MACHKNKDITNIKPDHLCSNVYTSKSRYTCHGYMIHQFVTGRPIDLYV